MPRPRSNIQRLADEGFPIEDTIPEAYKKVIEGLRPEEIALIIDMTRRLDQASECLESGEPHYTTCIPTF
ncbi:MAG TPA: aroma-sacti cluster domain-containing protein [Gaiellaceae bacterium]|jgi:hypothetical protein